MCEWTGVECAGSRVVEIKAEFFLTGDVALLAGVTRLEEIDLEKALVFGSIEVKNAPQTRLVHQRALADIGCLFGRRWRFCSTWRSSSWSVRPCTAPLR